MSKELTVLCEIEKHLRKISGSYDKLSVDDSTPVSIGDDLVPVKLAQRNNNRAILYLSNASSSTLYLGLNQNISENRYLLPLSGQNTLIMEHLSYPGMYKEEIWGFWATGAAGDSKCMVTEFYKTQ